MRTFISNRFAPTAKLSVRITHGVRTLRDGNPLPELKPGVEAELYLSPSDVIDDTARGLLLAERTVGFLSAGTSLWARVKSDEIPDGLRRYRAHKNAWPRQRGAFVQMQLASSVRLMIRGDGRTSLTDCVCGIVGLPTLECSSINEAYTRVSESFEPSRRSNTGNIFNCVFYEEGVSLHPLRKLRDEKLAANVGAPSA